MSRCRREYHDLVGDGPGLTMEEIAKIEGITRGGVWTVLQSAYRKIKRNPRGLEILRGLAEIAEAKRRRERAWIDEEAE